MTKMGRFLLVVIIAMAVPFMASAVERQIGYSGFLTNTVGSAPIADSGSPYTIVFSIYTVPTGGSAVWTETQSVTTVTGEFSVVLGANVGNPLNLDFASDVDYYLGIKVGTNAEMDPRKALLYVPFAFRSEKVETRTSDPAPADLVTGQMWLIVP